MSRFYPNWLPRRKAPPAPPDASPTPEKPADEWRSFYYSTEWRKLRALKVKMSPLCELCLPKDVYRTVEIVHHVEPIRDRPDLRLVLSNLQSVCQACHNRIHGRMDKHV